MFRRRRARGALLQSALVCDGTGVLALCVVAAAGARSTPRSTDDLGLAIAASTGAVSFAAAVAAAHLASAGGSTIRTRRSCRSLVVAGFALNTVGSIAVLRMSERHSLSRTSAKLLLTVGSILSGIYWKQIADPPPGRTAEMTRT